MIRTFMPQTYGKVVRRFFFAMVAAVGASTFSCAQDAVPAGAAAPIEGAQLVQRDPLEASKYLGSVYKMEAEGFKLTPPAGSRMIERRGVDLVSFVVDAKSWGGNLQLIDIPKGSMKINDFITSNKTELNKTFKGLQVLQEAYAKRDGKPSVRFDISMLGELGGVVSQSIADKAGMKNNGGGGVVALMRQQLVIQTKSDDFGAATQFLTLTMYTPLADKDKATRTFELMLKEFELFDSATLLKRRAVAIALGKDWLAGLSAEEFRKRLINEPQLFRILVEGNDVGYMRFDEMTQEPRDGKMVDVERDQRKGVLIQINHRAFRADGGVAYSQNEAFWSYSKDAAGVHLPDYSIWNNISKQKARVPVPAALARGGLPTMQEVLPWIQESGIISSNGKAEHVTVALSGDATQRLPAGLDTAVPVDAPMPLPKILEYTWTRFVDLTKPAEMSFVVYNRNANKLSLRNLIITGKREIVTIDGKSLTCYKCIDELDPASTTIWVDATGRIQMMQTSDQSIMIPTTEDAMKQKWGAGLNDQ